MFIVMNDKNKNGVIVPNVSSFYCKGTFLILNMLELDKPCTKVLSYANESIMIDDMENLGQEIRDYLQLSAFKDIEEPNKVGYTSDAVGDTSDAEYREEDDEEYEEDRHKIGF